MLSTRKKANAIKLVAKHDTDTGSAEVQISILSKRIEELTGHLKTNTGSAEVQISILSKRIEELTGHLKTNKKDNHSRRGLIQMVADRRKHIKYLEHNHPKTLKKVKETLGL